MKILSRKKQGSIEYYKLLVETKDDLWYLSHIISEGDKVKGITTRKIKLEKETEKKTMIIEIQVERVEFSDTADSLRILGIVIEEKEDVAKGSHHTITLEEGSTFSIEKSEWMKFQRKKFEEALEEKGKPLLIVLMDRDEAIFAKTKQQGYEILTKIKGEVAKKHLDQKQIKKVNFYQELAKLIEDYDKRINPRKIIIASPAFFSEYVANEIINKEISQKILRLTCSSVTESAIEEILKRDEVIKAVKKERITEETLLVDKLLNEISKGAKILKKGTAGENIIPNEGGKSEYGFEQVKKAVEFGAVETLLISEKLLKQMKEKEEYEKLDKLMLEADNIGADVVFISADHEAGRKLIGLGGIAAILRYKI